MPNLSPEVGASAFASLPAPSSCRLVDIDSASIHPGTVSDFFLVVRGTKPVLNMTVELRPVVYIQQPEYWVWEVVGCTDVVNLPATAEFAAAAAIGGATGTKGIDVAGANRTIRL